jgi:putative spermidine/putrescine transport system ATP-binding protein
MIGGALDLQGLAKSYGDFTALAGVSLSVAAGEFVTLLGPSGSGKTTTLSIVAGFTQADAGHVRLDGQDFTEVPAHRRDIGVVFQNYALFPHLSVERNVAFPLEMRKRPKAEIARAVGEALEKVHLAGLGHRRPRELSGGQQQRVALARALVFRPRLLLMDEPLGALDKNLRAAMQSEIVRISREIGITVLYVTHDQDEALAMSDRIAVFNRGRIEQVGTPREIYGAPRTRFVAGFMGEALLLPGRIDGGAGRPALAAAGVTVPLCDRAVAEAGLAHGADAVLVVRPERIALADGAGAGFAVPATVTERVFLGQSLRLTCRLPDGTEAPVRLPPGTDEARVAPGARLDLTWAPEAAAVVPAAEASA